LGLLLRGSVGFVIQCISAPRDTSYRQRIIIHFFAYPLTLFIQVNNWKLISAGCLIKTKEGLQHLSKHPSR